MVTTCLSSGLFARSTFSSFYLVSPHPFRIAVFPLYSLYHSRSRIFCFEAKGPNKGLLTCPPCLRHPLRSAHRSYLSLYGRVGQCPRRDLPNLLSASLRILDVARRTHQRWSPSAPIPWRSELACNGQGQRGGTRFWRTRGCERRFSHHRCMSPSVSLSGTVIVDPVHPFIHSPAYMQRFTAQQLRLSQRQCSS